MTDQPTAPPQNAPGDADSSPAVAEQATETRPPARKPGRGRRILVDVLLVLATILGILAIFSVWANRLLFSPDNWSKTSTQLLQNADIRNATSNYIVDQIYANVNVEALVRNGLPPRLEPLAGPAAGALRNAAVQGVNLALQRPRVQALWATANRAADRTFIAIVEGGHGHVAVNQGAVTLNLAGVVNDIASRLGLPSDIGSKLPANVANLTIFKSDQLKFVQNVGNGIKGLALWLTILVPLMYLGAIALAVGRRRRTLMMAGFAIVFAGIIAFLGRNILQNAIVNSLVGDDESVRKAARATMAIGTQMVTEIAGAFVFVGIVVIICAWFAGPARLATAGRRVIAPYLRDQPVVAFAATIGIMVLIFIWNPIPATGKPAGIIVFLALALFGTEMLRRQTAVEFPTVAAGEQMSAMRDRVGSWREHRRGPTVAGTADATSAQVSEQLERLAALHDRGAINDAEYDAAKTNLLHASGQNAMTGPDHG